MVAKKSKGLLNKYVHIYGTEPLQFFPEHEYVQQQAQIVSIVSCDEFGNPNNYEVQWFECGMGYPVFSKIINVNQMMEEKWGFYDDVETWKDEMDKTFKLFQRNTDRIERAAWALSNPDAVQPSSNFWEFSQLSDLIEKTPKQEIENPQTDEFYRD